MATRPNEHLEDDFTSRLIELAEALADETTVPTDTPTPEDPLAMPLRSARACLERIERFRANDHNSQIVAGDSVAFTEEMLDPDAPPQRIGRFEIIRELGRGGYGVVFLARDPNLQRDVALKVPRPEVMLSAELRQRFLREAKAAAALSHAHIVPVFETGRVGPIGYIASAFCPGTSLAQWLTAHPAPISPRVAGRIMVILAEAVQHAHGRGVLHRDLKPSNILLETPASSQSSTSCQGDAVAQECALHDLDDLSPLISDFGLAKILDASPRETRTAAILGTPAYMAPEQAAGRTDQIGPAADIYALGAILYELLVREPPLSRATNLATLQAVQIEEPQQLRRRRADVPRDLEAICSRCLEKDPARRYTTATALADDLNRFLAGKPVEAQPIGSAERLTRWCRRNPIVAGLTTTASVLLVAVAVVSSVAAWKLSREQAATQQNLDRAVEAEHESSRLATVARRRLFESLKAQAQSARNSGRAGQRFQSVAAIREAMDLGLELDEPQRLSLRNDAIASLSLVDVEINQTWPMSRNMIRHGLAFDPLVRRYAWRKDGRVVVYDVESQEAIQTFADLPKWKYVPQFRFGPNGQFLAAKCTTNTSTWIQVWNLDDSQTVLKAPSGGEWFYTDFDISPDGTTIAVSQPNHEVVGYDLRGVGEVFRHTVASTPRAVRFHPRRPQLVVALVDHAVLLDIASGEVVLRTDSVTTVQDIAIHPDGSMLAIGDDRGTVQLFDTTAGKLLRTLAGHSGAVVHIDFNHDGTLLATTSWDTTTRIWDPASGEQLLVTDMACYSFSRDNAWLGIGRVGVVAGRWKLAPPLEHQRLQAADDTAKITSLDVAPDGRLIAAGCNGCVLIWSTAPGVARAVLPTFGGGTSVAFDEAGTGLIGSDATGTYRWSIEHVEQTSEVGSKETLIRIGHPERLVDPSPSGWSAPAPRWLTQGLDVRHSRAQGSIEIGVQNNGKAIAELSKHPGVGRIAISPDRAWVATATVSGRDVIVWNVATGESVNRIQTRRADVAFSPDGTQLVVGTGTEYVVYQVPSWDVQYRIERTKSGGLPPQMAYDAEGATLAVIDEPWVVRLFDARDGREVASLVSPLTDIISVLSFRSAGQVLAAGTESGTVHFWDLGLIREQLADLRLDWEPAPESTPPRPESGRVVRFDVSEVSPLGALRALVSGDREDYARSCEFLQAIPPVNLSRPALTEITLACTTAAGGMTNSDRLTEFLQDELAKNPFHHDLVVPLMAVRHRCGDLTGVVKLATRERLIYVQAVNQPRFSNWVKGLRVLAFAHLAMSHQRLDHTDDARQYLEEAEELFDEVVAIQVSEDPLKDDLPPERFLAAESLLAEARALIERTD